MSEAHYRSLLSLLSDGWLMARVESFGLMMGGVETCDLCTIVVSMIMYFKYVEGAETKAPPIELCFSRFISSRFGHPSLQGAFIMCKIFLKRITDRPSGIFLADPLGDSRWVRRAKLEARFPPVAFVAISSQRSQRIWSVHNNHMKT